MVQKYLGSVQQTHTIHNIKTKVMCGQREMLSSRVVQSAFNQLTESINTAIARFLSLFIQLFLNQDCFLKPYAI